MKTRTHKRNVRCLALIFIQFLLSTRIVPFNKRNSVFVHSFYGINALINSFSIAIMSLNRYF